MPRIVVTAAVKDVEAWLKFKPDLIAQMSAVASDGTSYVAMDGSNRVASTWDVPDMEAFQAAQTAVSRRDGGGDGALRDDPTGDGLHREVAGVSAGRADATDVSLDQAESRAPPPDHSETAS